jgi:hypothetical protein
VGQTLTAAVCRRKASAVLYCSAMHTTGTIIIA